MILKYLRPTRGKIIASLLLSLFASFLVGVMAFVSYLPSSAVESGISSFSVFRGDTDPLERSLMKPMEAGVSYGLGAFWKSFFGLYLALSFAGFLRRH